MAMLTKQIEEHFVNYMDLDPAETSEIIQARELM